MQKRTNLKLSLVFILMAVLCTYTFADDNYTFINDVRDSEAIKQINKVAVFLDCPDTDYSNSFEDMLLIKLRNIGLEVVERVALEEVVAAEFKKLEKAMIDSGGMTIDQDISEASIAKLVDADFYITGSVLVGRKHFSVDNKNKKWGLEKITATTFTFQIIRARDQQTVLKAAYDFFHGENISYVIDLMTKYLKNLRS